MLHNPIRVVVGDRNAANERIDQQLVFVGREEGKLVAIRQLVQEGIKVRPRRRRGGGGWGSGKQTLRAQHSDHLHRNVISLPTRIHRNVISLPTHSPTRARLPPRSRRC